MGEQEEVFLFVRRPKTGLLANQWELPSVIMWEEAAKDVKELPLSPFGNQVKSVKNHFSSRPESGTDLAQIMTRLHEHVHVLQL